jgi:lipopolysaccharide/colanic/teichoic acid biosynthesis glycosyltransferase/GT2 family glycosyltransferase
MRRVLDIAFAMIVILLFLPLWIILVAILRLTGEGKIFYRQPRIGFGGRTFKIVKFATMLEDSPNLGTGDITLKNDPRVLPIGRFLRKTKINEIPQIINVLKGEMTLVGPRPLTPRNFSFYSEHVQRVIATVRPGLTGVGSIVFRDEETIISNSGRDYLECFKNQVVPYKAELELWYIRNRTSLLDLKILALTLWVVFFHESMLYKKLLKGLPVHDDWQAKDEADKSQSHELVLDDPTKPQPRISANQESSTLLPLYVITVNYRSDQHLKQLIQSFGSLDIITKLIIVDHSESERLTNVSAPFPMHLVAQENRGYGAGLNRGLRHVDHTDAVVLVCNPDIELMTPETMSDAVRYIQDNPRVACLVPCLVNSQSQPIFSSRRFYTLMSIVASRIGYMRENPNEFRRHHFYLDQNADNIFEVDWGSGAALFLRGSLFPHPLSFDERFFLYFEDVDLCTQIRKQELSVVHYPKVVFKHHEQRRSVRNIRHLALHMSSVVKYMWKYRGFPQGADVINNISPTLTD